MFSDPLWHFLPQAKATRVIYRAVVKTRQPRSIIKFCTHAQVTLFSRFKRAICCYRSGFEVKLVSETGSRWSPSLGFYSQGINGITGHRQKQNHQMWGLLLLCNAGMFALDLSNSCLTAVIPFLTAFNSSPNFSLSLPTHCLLSSHPLHSALTGQ